MGASCSSTVQTRYRDALTYLRSKTCATYTYLVAYRPRYKKLPHLIIMGESHEYTPSSIVGYGKKSCSTVTGILNEVVSVCSDPSVKTTVVLENIYQHKVQNYSATDALLKTPDDINPFNVNRQEVILDFARKNFPKNSIEVVDSDIFYSARFNLVVERIQDLESLEENTTRVLQKWLGENYGITEDKFKILEEKAKPLTIEHMGIYDDDDDFVNDEFIQRVILFAFTILVFLETNTTVLFSKRVYNHVYAGFEEYFNAVENNFVKHEQSSRKRGIDDGFKDHSRDIGMLITYLSDSLNFHRMSKMEGIVLISYGQHHAQTFENMVLSSRWYDHDFESGETLPNFIF